MSTQPFSLLIKPTSADCNLRCEYCFYLGKKDLYPDAVRHRMSDEVLERMISTFLATNQPQHSFGWQGGEPTLMGLDFFKNVISLQKQYGSGKNVSNGLQTNTTLIDDDFAKHLAEFYYLCGVSIDGPAEIHDHYRKYIDGRGAHSSVMEGLKKLKSNKVEYNVLTLVSQSNVKKPAEIYRYLCDMGVNFHQYIECVEFDSDGALMPFAINGEEWGDFLCGIFDEWVKGDQRKVSVRLFDSILMMMVEGVPNVCAMGTNCRQYLVVEHNGDIYPCDFFVNSKMKLGNIMHNSWEEMLNSPIYEEFGSRKSNWNSECAKCEYLKYCAGCCPKNRPGKSDDPTQMSALCDGWKQFYHHSLKEFRALANGVIAERNQHDQQSRNQSGQPRPSGNIGRNSPCPCGSMRKYKHCCGK